MKRETFIKNEQKRDALVDKAIKVIEEKHPHIKGWWLTESFIEVDGLSLHFEYYVCGDTDRENFTLTWDELGY